MEGSGKPKGSMKKEIVKGAIAIGAATLLLLVLVAISEPGDEGGEPVSDIRLAEWSAANVYGGLNFTVNATNYGDAIGAATIICEFETYNDAFNVSYPIHLGPGKSYSFVIFMPLPEGVILEQGQESVTILQN